MSTSRPGGMPAKKRAGDAKRAREAEVAARQGPLVPQNVEPPPPPPPKQEGGSFWSSIATYVLMAGFLMVAAAALTLAIVLVGGAIYWKIDQQRQADLATEQATRGNDKEHFRDTGGSNYVKPERQQGRTGGGTTVVEAVVPDEPAAPKPTHGTVTVKVPVSDGMTSVEIKCETSGTRARGTFNNGVATIKNVPVDEGCAIFFKGPGEPAQFKPVRGGASYICTFLGTTAICQ